MCLQLTVVTENIVNKDASDKNNKSITFQNNNKGTIEI